MQAFTSLEVTPDHASKSLTFFKHNAFFFAHCQHVSKPNHRPKGTVIEECVCGGFDEDLDRPYLENLLQGRCVSA